MKADLMTRLRANAGLTGFVDQRIRWGLRPRGETLPGLTMQIVAPGRIYHHGGAASLTNPRVRFKCWGRTEAEAGDVAGALTAAIEATGTTGATAFKGAFLESEATLDPETMGDGTDVHCVIRDFTVWHQPA